MGRISERASVGPSTHIRAYTCACKYECVSPSAFALAMSRAPLRCGVRRYLRKVNAFDACHNYYAGERLLTEQRERERERSVLLPRGRTSLVRTCRWWRVYVSLGACVCTVNGAARGTDSTELITDLCKMLFRWTRRINKRPFSKLVNRRHIPIYIDLLYANTNSFNNGTHPANWTRDSRVIIVSGRRGVNRRRSRRLR